MYNLLTEENKTRKKMNLLSEIHMIQNVEELKMWRQKNILLIIQKCHFMFDFVEDIKKKFDISDQELWISLKEKTVPPKLLQANLLTNQSLNAARAEDIALQNIGYKGKQPYQVVIAALCLFSQPKVVKAGAFAKSMEMMSNFELVSNAFDDKSILGPIQSAGFWHAVDKLEDGKKLDVVDKIHLGVEAVSTMVKIGELVNDIISLFSDE